MTPSNIFKLSFERVIHEQRQNSILEICQTLQKTEKIPECIMLEQEINLVQLPTLPRQRSSSPLPGHDAQSNARGDGGVEASI